MLLVLLEEPRVELSDHETLVVVAVDEDDGVAAIEATGGRKHATRPWSPYVLALRVVDERAVEELFSTPSPALLDLNSTTAACDQKET